MVELGKIEDEIFQFCQKYEEHFNDYQKCQQVPKAEFTLKEIQNCQTTGILTSSNGKRRNNDENGSELKSKLTKQTMNDENLMNNDENECPKNNDGFKERYYRQKFGTIQIRRKVALAYTEGLCWVFKYYRQGCPSWDWYYPYHYAPFSSDFDTISQLKVDWSKPTKPFNPLEQQMAIFPPATSKHVPVCWQSLMTSQDSPIRDFYPTDFKIDMEGKTYSSQGIALLPFVDEKLLIRTLKSTYDKLTDEEKARNIFGSDLIFVGRRHSLFKSIIKIYSQGRREFNKSNNQNKWVPINEFEIAGEVNYNSTARHIGVYYPNPFPGSEKFKDIQVNGCIMMAYRCQKRD